MKKVKKLVRKKVAKKKSVRKKPIKKRKAAKKIVRKKPVKRVLKPKKRKMVKKRRVVKKRPIRKKPVKRVVKRKPIKKRVKPKKRKVVKKKPVKKKKVVKRRSVRKKTAKKPKKKLVKRRVVKRRPAKRARKKPAKKPVKRKVGPKKRKTAKRSVKKRAIRKKPTKKMAKKKRRPKKRVIKRKKKKVIRKKRVTKRKLARRKPRGGGPLEQLFESPVKVQVMKLFFRNPEESFLLKEATKIMRQNLARVRQEIKRLEKIGLLRAKQISPRKQSFSVNPNFDFFNELRELILRSSPVSKDKMLKAIRGLGKIKLVLLSGLFIGNGTVRIGQGPMPYGTRQGMSRADLLIVGDNINQRKLAGFIKNLEAEAGTDINCVVMSTEEFNYRYDMYDRFVRDLLSEKCEFLINRLGL